MTRRRNPPPRNRTADYAALIRPYELNAARLSRERLMNLCDQFVCSRTALMLEVVVDPPSPSCSHLFCPRNSRNLDYLILIRFCLALRSGAAIRAPMARSALPRSPKPAVRSRVKSRNSHQISARAQWLALHHWHPGAIYDHERARRYRHHRSARGERTLKGTKF